MIKIGKKGYTPLGILWIIVEYVSLIFFGLCAVVPVISCVITAFKTSEEYQQTNVMTLPERWLNFDNFTKAFEAANMGRAFLNSVIVMVCVLIVSVILGTQLAYVLNRFKFPGNTLIRNLYLFASLLPAVAMQVTVFNIMSALHLVNSLVGYIIMMCYRRRFLLDDLLEDYASPVKTRNRNFLYLKGSGRLQRVLLC